MAGTTLFVYGTLREPRLVRELTGRTFPARPATLLDHERIIPPRGYPYVVPRPGVTVDGLLLDDIDAGSLAHLDAYEEEGTLYARRQVRASADGRLVACETYVGNPERLHGRYG